MARTKQTPVTPQPPVQTQVSQTVSTAPKETETTGKTKRVFRIVLPSIKPTVEDASKLPKDGGKYTSFTPGQSSKKVYTKLRKCFTDPERSIEFSIEEITSGRVFSYVGTRTKRDTPLMIKKGDSEFSINYHTEVKSLRKKTTSEVETPSVPSTTVVHNEPPPPTEEVKSTKQTKMVTTQSQVTNSLNAKRPRGKSVKA